MSGIVGSAGSKSGIIGTTELDYEEGTWTPTNNGGAVVVTSHYARYIKIGKAVHLTAYWDHDNSGDASAIEIGGLPFPNSSITNAHYAWQGHFNNIHDQGAGNKDHVLGRFRVGDSYCKLYRSGSNTALDENQIDETSVLMSGTYFID